MKLTHIKLIELGQKFGYSFDAKGICHGFTSMWGQAVCAGEKEEENFYQRLALIDGDIDKPQALIDNIKQLRERIKSKRTIPLTEKELLLIEIPAFFEGVEIYHNPRRAHLLLGESLSQINVKAVSKITASKALENNDGIEIIFNSSYAFTPNVLQVYLEELENILSSSVKIAVYLRNDEHVVGVKYDTKQKKWRYVDINVYGAFINASEFYQTLSTQELVRWIFKSFQDASSDSVFNIKIQSSKYNPALDTLKEGLTFLTSLFVTEANHASMRNSRGVGLLYMAAKNNELSLANQLLEYADDVNQASTNSGKTPLYIACENRNLDVIQAFLEKGANVNQASADGGLTPLYMACQNGDLDVVQILLKFGANPNQANTIDGATPLHLACHRGSLDVVQILLEKGANPNQARTDNGLTPLHIACLNESLSLEVVQTLLEKGVNVNQASTDVGITPFYLACQYGNLAVAQVLLKYGANVNQARTDNGPTPLYMACQAGNRTITVYLLKAGLNIEAIGRTGHTSLQVACLSPETKDKQALFELLLANNASLTHENDAGQTALDIAFEQDNQAAITAILNHAFKHALKLNSIANDATTINTISWVNDNYTLNDSSRISLIQDMLILIKTGIKAYIPTFRTEY